MSQTSITTHSFNQAARTCVCLLTAAALLSFDVTVALAQEPASQSQPVVAFVSATNDYTQVHRRLERQIGSIEISSSIASINRTMQQLAAALRAERPDAKQGDLFTPALAQELRVRIEDALAWHGFTAADVRDANRVDSIDDRTIRLRVNDRFPWALGVAMFPCLLAALPPLPPELQYRIVDNDLLLIDWHASLIVDILPAALIDDEPPAAAPKESMTGRIVR